MFINPPIVEREDTLAEFARFERREHLAVDLHAAVDLVDERQKLCLRALGQHRRAEFRLAVMRENQVLQKRRLFLGQVELGGDRRDLCARSSQSFPSVKRATRNDTT